MTEHIADAMAMARHWHLEVAEDGTLRYPVLSLSRGGSYVAFATGVLAGWTEAGNRPEFRVVTAMSGGALVAPWAFLGPDHDPVLEAIFTTADMTDIYRAGPLGLLNAVLSDGAFDFSPGRDLIARYMTEEVVDAIAEAHRDGRRLYIATANMDDNVATPRRINGWRMRFRWTTPTSRKPCSGKRSCRRDSSFSAGAIPRNSGPRLRLVGHRHDVADAEARNDHRCDAPGRAPEPHVSLPDGRRGFGIPLARIHVKSRKTTWMGPAIISQRLRQ